MKFLYVFRAHWQLLVMYPGDNIVLWFCSLRKKPDAAIKAAVNSAMKSLSKSEEGKPAQPVPQWIEAKSHVQMGNYECGYYVMHCAYWFSDGTTLTKETMTTLQHKWAGYFLQMKNSKLRKI
ncbi:hypothetical protein GmHk_19G054588 [Glycine max]|nr:hypothetical protein GmHk_19G054588 [Glycine max]